MMIPRKIVDDLQSIIVKESLGKGQWGFDDGVEHVKISTQITNDLAEISIVPENNGVGLKWLLWRRIARWLHNLKMTMKSLKGCPVVICQGTYDGFPVKILIYLQPKQNDDSIYTPKLHQPLG